MSVLGLVISKERLAMKYESRVIDSLATLYAEYDTTVDQLALRPEILSRIACELNQQTVGAFDGMRTLDALLYARKIGRLPRLRRKPR